MPEFRIGMNANRAAMPRTRPAPVFESTTGSQGIPSETLTELFRFDSVGPWRKKNALARIFSRANAQSSASDALRPGALYQGTASAVPFTAHRVWLQPL
jgi:hypothetical protein